MEKERFQLGLDAMYLLGCALHGQKPHRMIESDLEQIFSFCKFHSIAATVAPAVKALELPAECFDPFRQSLARSLRKSILLNVEATQVQQYLEEIGCWYLPLKGSLIQNDYPQLGMRQMNDHDILIDPQYQDQVHDYMLRHGYEPSSIHLVIENSYQKPPIYNIEIHTALFGSESPKAFLDYYEGLEKTMLLAEPGSCKRSFSPEDFYVYMIAHAYKHAMDGGIGVRFLADIWIRRNRSEQMDEAVVRGELRKLGIAEFEEICRSISEKLFDDPEAPGTLTESESQLLHTIFAAGTNGTVTIRMENNLNRMDGKFKKFRYMVSRAFPSAQELAAVYPVVLEKPFLLPLLQIWRLLCIVCTRPLSAVRELKMLLKK